MKEVLFNDAWLYEKPEFCLRSTGWAVRDDRGSFRTRQNNDHIPHWQKRERSSPAKFPSIFGTSQTSPKQVRNPDEMNDRERGQIR
jgi:hypothetical protein